MQQVSEQSGMTPSEGATFRLPCLPPTVPRVDEFEPHSYQAHVWLYLCEQHLFSLTRYSRRRLLGKLAASTLPPSSPISCQLFHARFPQSGYGRKRRPFGNSHRGASYIGTARAGKHSSIYEHTSMPSLFLGLLTLK